MKYYKVENVKGFLKNLMDEKIVEALILPLKSYTEEAYNPFLIKDKGLIDKSEPFAFCMGINTAKEVSKLTFKGALPFKTGIVLKPCELRAFRELIKLNQINPENLVTICCDCNGFEDREICEMCVDFVPDYADIKILSLGLEGYYVETDLELQLEENSGNLENREKEISKILDEKRKNRDKRLSEIKSNLKELLKNCISCHNCMRVCPICFCQECFFDSPALKNDSVTYLMRASRKNGLDFPENKLLFHLGRMNHMSVSCVSCGVCEEVCPAQIPVSQIFAAAGDELKKLFNYQPGKSLEDKIPFTCYQHDELHDFEKEYK